MRIRIAIILSNDQESVQHDRDTSSPPETGHRRPRHPPARHHHCRRSRQPSGRGPAPAPGRRTDAPREAGHPLGHHPVHAGHSPARRGGPAAQVLEPARRAQPAGALLGHRLPRGDHRLPPDAEPPSFPSAPVAGALLRHLRRPQLPARSDRLGGPAPPPPQVFRHRGRPPQQPQGLLVEPHGLDVRPHPSHGRRTPAHRRPGPRSLLPLAEQLVSGPATTPWCAAVLDRQCQRCRWLGPGAVGHPPAPGGRLPLHLAGEFGHPPLG